MGNDSEMRQFETGATRSALGDKPQYEGYLSPLVIRRYGQYMAQHQIQADGRKRAADNWQKGMPKGDYVDSLWRHFLDVWGMHRGAWDKTPDGGDIEDALCALLFNGMGLLHEILKEKVDEAC